MVLKAPSGLGSFGFQNLDAEKLTGAAANIKPDLLQAICGGVQESTIPATRFQYLIRR